MPEINSKTNTMPLHVRVMALIQSFPDCYAVMTAAFSVCTCRMKCWKGNICIKATRNRN